MVIAKQMDIRSNIKKYFDIAFDGEVVVVPRKAQKNVVIISEKEYNTLTQTKRISAYAELLTSAAMGKVSSESKVSTQKDINIEKLNIIKSFRNNWNGNGAPAFPGELISKVAKLIDKMPIQPQLFPTALTTIQFEFDNSIKDHMEIEIGLGDEAQVFIVKSSGEETEYNIQANSEEVNKKVLEFYG